MAERGEQPLTRLRAYRVCLDPTPAQLQLLAQHAGAQRWAFNQALGWKVAAHKQLVAVRHELAVARGVDPEDRDVLRSLTKEAATLAPRIPSAIDNLAAWRKVRGDERTGEVGISPWWPSVSSYAISSGMRAADVAFANWLDSLAGRRRGRRMGYPRFKRKGRARDSFTTLFHDVKKPTRLPPAAAAAAAGEGAFGDKASLGCPAGEEKVRGREMRLPTTTMVGCFEGNPAGETVFEHVLRGEWFLEDPSTPACGVVRYVRPDETNDGIERMFVCDLPAGHTEDRHRQVTDVAAGETLTWSAD